MPNAAGFSSAWALGTERQWDISGVLCGARRAEASGAEFRYYAETPEIEFPPELHDYNARFTKVLEAIKRRHDPTVTTVAQGVLEWKKSHNTKHIGLDIQAWLDRFYLSRIGIRFLIGQRELCMDFCLK